MKLTGNRFSVILASIVVLAAQTIVTAQASDVLYFAETGHTVRGEFLKLYSGAGDPKLVYGYPITEQMTSRDGMTVQYFQRARFELTIDSRGTPHAKPTALGHLLYEPGEQQNIYNPRACQFFASTGFSVCFQFLDFYHANGGLDRFGQPISPFEFHDNVLVQYFELARFEWRTDGFDGRVVLTELGRIYFDQVGEDPAQLHPVEPADASINAVLAIKISAFVSKPIATSTGDQTVFVIVRSQTNEAVPDASGIATIRFPDNTVQSISFTTGTRGVGQFSFNFNDQTAGDVIPIEISISYQGLFGSTRTSFRIWY